MHCSRSSQKRQYPGFPFDFDIRSALEPHRGGESQRKHMLSFPLRSCNQLQGGEILIDFVMGTGGKKTTHKHTSLIL